MSVNKSFESFGRVFNSAICLVFGTWESFIPPCLVQNLFLPLERFSRQVEAPFAPESTPLCLFCCFRGKTIPETSAKMDTTSVASHGSGGSGNMSASATGSTDELYLKFAYNNEIRLRPVPEEISFGKISKLALSALDGLKQEKSLTKNKLYFTYKDMEDDVVHCKNNKDLEAAVAYARSIGKNRLRLDVHVSEEASATGEKKKNKGAGKKAKDKKHSNKEQATAERDFRTEAPERAPAQTQKQPYPRDFEEAFASIPPQAVSAEQAYGYSTNRTLCIDADLAHASSILQLLDSVRFVDDAYLQELVSGIYANRQLVSCFAEVLVQLELLSKGKYRSVSKWVKDIESLPNFKKLKQYFTQLNSHRGYHAWTTTMSVSELYKLLMGFVNENRSRSDRLILPRLMEAIDYTEERVQETGSAWLERLWQSLARIYLTRIEMIQKAPEASASSSASSRNYRVELVENFQQLSIVKGEASAIVCKVRNRGTDATPYHVPWTISHRSGDCMLPRPSIGGTIEDLAPGQVKKLEVQLQAPNVVGRFSGEYGLWVNENEYVGSLQVDILVHESEEHLLMHPSFLPSEVDCGLRILNQPHNSLSLNPSERIRYNFSITNQSSKPMSEPQEIFFHLLDGNELRYEDDFCRVLPRMNPSQTHDDFLMIRAPQTPGRSEKSVYSVTLGDEREIGRLVIRINTNNTNAHDVFNRNNEEVNDNSARADNNGNSVFADNDRVNSISHKLHQDFRGIELETIMNIVQACGGNEEVSREQLENMS